MMHETIFALASAPGRSGIAVIRLSGKHARAALAALSGLPVLTPRVATLCDFSAPESDEVLDRGLALWFPAPASFTGEDVAELHVHGGRAVIQGVIEALAAQDGLRPAEPGEFTRRAFANGKLDLTAAEGLADLVAADTAAQRRQALRQLGGALATYYEGLRRRLIAIMAHVVADIDFADEGDVPEGLTASGREGVRALHDEIFGHLDDDHRGERLRDGFYITILGPPNAGKSSLLNVLARREAAIVAASAGTTRDVIEVQLDIGGFPVTLADTAGIRDAAGAIESEGVARAKARAGEADLKLMVVDGSVSEALDATLAGLIDTDTLILINKIDLMDRAPTTAVGEAVGYAVSVRDGTGMSEFLSVLQQAVSERLDVAGGAALTRIRHRVALEDCAAALARSLDADAVELVAEDLRLAARALGRITGTVDVEDILDHVFGEFCIGK